MALERGRVIGYEYDRMVMLFSMMDGDKEIPCAVSSSAMDDLERGAKPSPTSAKSSSCGCATGSNNAPRANSSPGSSRAPRPASSCAASIFGPRAFSGLAESERDSLSKQIMIHPEGW